MTTSESFMRIRTWILGLALVAHSACRTVDAPPVASAVQEADATDLDARFGKAYPPAYSKAWETNPDGTTIINPGIQHCVGGEGILLDPEVKQIWADLEDGTLVIGEEVMVGAEPNGKKRTLGHPTLTNSGKARIAGEIRWKNDLPVINNKSGRYSAHPDRTADKLDNAAALFSECGWDVSTKYVDMTPGDQDN